MARSFYGFGLRTTGTDRVWPSPSLVPVRFLPRLPDQVRCCAGAAQGFISGRSGRFMMSMLVAVICSSAIGLGFPGYAENAGAADGGTMPGRMVASGSIIQGNAAKLGTGADGSSLIALNNDGSSGPAGTVSISSVNAMRSYLDSITASTHDTGDLNFISADGTRGPAGAVSIFSVNALNNHLSSAGTSTNEPGTLKFLSDDGTSGPAGTVSMSSLNALNSYLTNQRLLQDPDPGFP